MDRHQEKRLLAFVQSLQQQQSSMVCDYLSLKNFLCVLNSKKIYPIRQNWENVISGKCDKSSNSPCKSCNGCWRKFLQLVIVIKCASGVSDKIVIPHWTNIFHKWPYKYFGLYEWSHLPLEHFAALCEPCSCWIKNTMYLKYYFHYLYFQKKQYQSIYQN